MRRVFPHRASRSSRCALLAASLAASLPSAALAQAEGYRLDPVHTRVMFTISHAGYSQAIGTVSGSTGAIVFDPDDWSSARLSVEVPLRRLDMGDAGWTHAVLARRFLDATRFPLAKFVSGNIEPLDTAPILPAPANPAPAAPLPVDPQTAANGHPGIGQDRPAHARVCGTLTLHGVARPLCMEVTFNKLRHYPLPPFRTTAGFSATAVLKRSDFGITAWKSLVGDEVRLRIEAEAFRDGDVLKAIDANRPPAQDLAAPARDDDAPVPADQQVPPP